MKRNTFSRSRGKGDGEPASTDRTAAGVSGEDDGDREREGRREWRGGVARVEAAA